jgi:hypothetical protein
MEELPTRAEQRIEELKEAFIEDEIDEQTFDTLFDAAMEDDAPFRADWFMRQRETRRKRYSKKDVYMYCGEEYVVEGEMVVPADIEEDERVIKARGGESAVTADFYEVEREEPSDEVKMKQEELRESLGLDG